MCPLCIKNNIYVVEDEFHFFFECNEYEVLRQTFFKTNWLNNRSLNMFYIIISLKDEKSLFSIARYLLMHLQEERKLLIYNIRNCTRSTYLRNLYKHFR